ncbi:MAG: hypothetical protein AAB552_00495 [Patescibacteria group bacterium]
MEFLQMLGFQELYNQTLSILVPFFKAFPYWGPLFVAGFFWKKWKEYTQERWISGMKWIMLEIKLPKEIHKSPVATELFLNALYQTSQGKWLDHVWKGRVRDWFSLEMVSLEGQIKFFIRTTEIYKNVIEAQLYAQYPEIEIYEVPDYTRYVNYKGKEGDWEMIGIDFKLTKKDFYPIKTYIDYGLDKEGIKEEFKIDPLTSIIEYLGSAGKGEQIWIQILVQAAQKRHKLKTDFEKKKAGEMGDWKDEAREWIDERTKRNEKPEEGKAPAFKMLMMTKGDTEIVAAVERSMGKFGFDCGIRALYLSKKDKFNPSNIRALPGLFRAFTTSNLNGFEIKHNSIGFDYFWQDYNKIRITKKRKEQFEAYKHRSWFYGGHSLLHGDEKEKPFVLTTEELATIFHFPGGVAQTPTFGRIPSRKAEAPINLPI